MFLSLAKVYKDTFNSDLDERKAHVLLYYVQKKSLSLYVEPVIDEDFHGWEFSPVLKSVIVLYHYTIVPKLYVDQKVLELILSIVKEYGGMDSWKLSSMVQKDSAWRESRIGLKKGQNGDRVISMASMVED